MFGLQRGLGMGVAPPNHASWDGTIANKQLVFEKLARYTQALETAGNFVDALMQLDMPVAPFLLVLLPANGEVKDFQLLLN